ncbi:phage portal protein [Lactobacillus acetotolerans]|uniref:phage portal protein n=1 Tax=Lactobacillus acetotolerans TaxID=1600 RepID=UPI002FD92037
MTQENLLYQDDLGNLNEERIMQFIQHHHDQQVPRLEKLDRYYRGDNVAITDASSRRVEKGKADYRAKHSFAKYIADFQTAYSVGNPVTVKTIDNDDRLDHITNANDTDSLNYDLFLDMTRYGRAYEYIYMGQDDVEHSVRLDPLDTFVIYSLNVDPTPIMAVRYHKIEVIDGKDKNIKYIPETFTATEHVTYQPTAIGSVMEPESKEPLQVFPVIEYKNNQFRLGDYENVLTLIDLYDAAQSDTANYMTDLNDALLVIQGDIDALLNNAGFGGINPEDTKSAQDLAESKMQMIEEMKDANMLLLRSGISSSGNQTSVDAKYINKEYDVNGTEAYKKRLASDIHKFSHTPDLTDEKFSSNISGIAMKYKLLGTVEMAAIKRRMFEKGLYERYSIIASLESKASTQFKTNVADISFTFTDNLPENDIEIIQTLQKAGATLPQEYLYQYLPGVTDPSQITDMLKKQGGDGYDDTTGNNPYGQELGGSDNN